MAYSITKDDVLKGNDVSIGANLTVKYSKPIYEEYGSRGIRDCLNGFRSFGKLYETNDAIENPVEISSKDGRVFYGDGNDDPEKIERLKAFVSKSFGRSMVSCHVKIVYEDGGESYTEDGWQENCEDVFSTNTQLWFDKDTTTPEQAANELADKVANKTLNESIPEIIEDRKSELLEKLSELDMLSQNNLEAARKLEDNDRNDGPGM